MNSEAGWRYFKASEFDCQHCGQNEMDPDFVDLLDRLRYQVGIPLVVSSGYRCPEHNNAVSHTGFDGPHTTGKAADILIDRQDAYKVLHMALQLGFTGVGVNQKGNGRFLHLDLLEEGVRPTVWSY